MEIFMRNVDFSASRHDVTRAIAEKLHVPEFTISMPLNFHVRLFKSNRGTRQSHKGMGTLTLPTEDVGRRFLLAYGERGRPLLVRNRPVRLQISNKPPTIDVLQNIQETPYLDPAVIEEREERARILSGSTVELARVQFGWDCRDGVFSVEWEHICEQPGAHLVFEYDKRQIVILTPMEKRHFEQAGPFELMLPGNLAQITISYSQIESISATTTSGEAALFFYLTIPPSFQTTSDVDLTIASWQPGIVKAQRRFLSLPLTDTSGRPHSEISSYTSLALRLVCRSREDVLRFTQATRTAELNLRIDDSEYFIERRGLFSRQVLYDLFTWFTQISFDTAYQIEALVRNQDVDPREIMELRPEINQLILVAKQKGTVDGAEYIRQVMQDFGRKARFLYWSPDEPKTLKQCFLDSKRDWDRSSSRRPTVSRPNDDDLFMCLHVTITPSAMYLEGPLPERSNRVIRSYHPRHRANFIRVSFGDEGKLKMMHNRDIDGPAFVNARVGPILLEGLKLAGRRFFFLAYSQSALKEHAVWFLRPFKENGRIVDVESVIQSLGSFSDLAFDRRLIYCPARYAARISQGFTTTDPTTTEVENVVLDMPDIKTVDSNGTVWTATDGVGTMSPEFARSVYAERLRQRRGRRLRLEDYPRALQIRFRGSKGMLSVDHTIEGMTICLRPSMIKFDGAESKTIEIAKVFDKPGTFYLNRPLIMLLEGLGVPYESFKRHQDAAVEAAHQATESFELAAHFFESHGLGTSFRLPSIMLNLAKLEATMPQTDFFDNVMEYGVNHVLRLLKHKARIPVPGAYNLVGIADIHGFLGPGQIFACIKPIDGSRRYLKGPVVISRSPTIHPGDVQIVQALGKPPLDSPFYHEPLANTVVFNTKDMRPLPSCLGGGDLDGDEYNVIPLVDLPEFRIDPSRTQPPGLYPAATRNELDRPCEHADIARFFMGYITSDLLGYISINWRIIADQSEQHILDPICIELAELHSLAVDYPKSGNPVPIASIPKRPNTLLPDWYAPETMQTLDTERYYPSQRAIGRLFRDIDLPAAREATRGGRRRRFRRRFGSDDEDLVITADLATLNVEDEDPLSVYNVIHDRIADFIDEDETTAMDDIPDLLRFYRSELQNICSTHTLSHHRAAMLREEEALVGTIVANTSQPRKRLDHISKLREQMDGLVRRVRDNIVGDEDTVSPEQSLERARFAYRLSVGKKTFGAQSFGWIALGAVFDAIKEIEAAEQRHASSRYRRM
ncbi:RNA-directed RNA polymerase 2 [Mycena floridula]|nr:RNA-directed RNA polymerase 2 [Mycena floridula]